MEFIKKIINKTTCGPFWVMYDHECPLCCKVVSSFKKFDYFNKVQWLKKNFKGDFPKEAISQIDSTIVLYDPEKSQVFYRSEATFKIISCFPFGVFILWTLKIPGVLRICNFWYKKISNNRYHICSK